MDLHLEMEPAVFVSANFVVIRVTGAPSPFLWEDGMGLSEQIHGLAGNRG